MSRRTATVPVSAYLLLPPWLRTQAHRPRGVSALDAYSVVKLGQFEGPRKLAELGIRRSGNRRHRIAALPNWDSNH